MSDDEDDEEDDDSDDEELQFPVNVKLSPKNLLANFLSACVYLKNQQKLMIQVVDQRRLAHHMLW